MDRFQELQNYSFHATWDLGRSLVKPFNILVRQIDEHIRDETHETFVEEGLLFKSYLYMSGIGGTGNKDTEIAKDCLKDVSTRLEAWNESPKKDGFCSVAYALEAWVDMDKTKKKLNDLKQLHLKHTQATKACFEACNHYIKGFALSRLGINRYDECVEEFRQATEKCPDDVEYLFSLAFMTRRVHGSEVGVEYKDMLLKVLEKKDDYLFAKVELANLAYIEGNTDGATNLLEDITSTLANEQIITPENMKIVGHVMKIYLQLNKPEKAEALYLIAEHNGKVNSFVTHKRATVARYQKDWKHYEIFLNAAVKMNPFNLAVSLPLAINNLRKSEADDVDVIKMFSKILSDRSSDELGEVQILSTFGNMLMKKRNEKAAVVRFENAMEKAFKYCQRGKSQKIKFSHEITLSVQICVTNLRNYWKKTENRNADNICNLATLENNLGNLYLARSYCNDALEMKPNEQQMSTLIFILSEIQIQVTTDSKSLSEVEKNLNTITSAEFSQKVTDFRGKLDFKKGILYELKHFPFGNYTNAAISGNVRAVQRLFSALDIMDNTSSQYYQICASINMSIMNIKVAAERDSMQDRLKMVLESAFTGEQRNLRKQQFEMEKLFFNGAAVCNADAVIQTASNLLNRAMHELTQRYRPARFKENRTLDFFCIYDNFYKEQTKEKVKSKLTEYKWENIDDELISFLVEIQPCTNPQDNNWIMAFKKFNNTDKHQTKNKQYEKYKVYPEDPSANRNEYQEKQYSSIDLARTVCNNIAYILDNLNGFSLVF
ncbi:uncharacterized protein LOC117103176 [Anneissia japonica]|uniref:uncharacterized protein LOC117103176 n=1 Tax=Anneissia japonica TaxID=1529436 RepID=UPI0014259CCC|nr:uncharacterized protein LOC117103176 [Anneissia japonica]XP_033099572.1 uncharacterized protein LOC117103176 [Anneissia japonica]